MTSYVKNTFCIYSDVLLLILKFGLHRVSRYFFSTLGCTLSIKYDLFLAATVPRFVCVQMTDMAIVYLTAGCQFLLELDLSGCKLLTDRSLKNLKKICPPLKTIKLNDCTGISWYIKSQKSDIYTLCENLCNKFPFFFLKGGCSKTEKTLLTLGVQQRQNSQLV